MQCFPYKYVKTKRTKNIRFLPFFNSQTLARKNNPQVPVSSCAAFPLKERSHSSKISSKVFGGAENQELNLNCEIYPRKSRKLHISISIFR